MPGAPVGVLLALERIGQRLMCRTSLAERCPLVDGRANEWMSKLETPCAGAQQACRFRRVKRLRGGPERSTGTQDRVDVARVVGCRNEKQSLRLCGQSAHAFEERLLECDADRRRLGQQLAAR